jgi:hypothetical protein
MERSGGVVLERCDRHVRYLSEQSARAEVRCTLRACTAVLTAAGPTEDSYCVFRSIDVQAMGTQQVTTDHPGLSIAWGSCGHIFHLDCIKRWLRTRSVCPLCNREWELAKTEQIHGYALLD